MPLKSTALKKSFFKDYFLFKLRGLSRIAAVSAVFVFLSTTIAAAVINGYLNEIIANYLKNDFSMFGLSILIITAIVIVPLSIAATFVTAAITPALSFKLYNNRAYTDMLGCLPLTYKERFWGDFLSGLCANLASFIPFSAAGLIVAEVTKNTTLRENREIIGQIILGDHFLERVQDDLTLYMLKFYLTLLICCISAYSISCFVTSCCGKISSAILYSFITMTSISGIAAAYGGCLFWNAAGLDSLSEIANVVIAVPPVGVLGNLILNFFSLVYFDRHEYVKVLAVDSPAAVCLAAAVTAAALAGAYFLGKHRKNERADSSFVYGGAYQAISTVLTAAVFGAYCMVDGRGTLRARSVVTAAAVAFAVHLSVELLRKRSFRKFWKSVVKFAAVFAVCFGYMWLVQVTDHFNIAKTLPEENSVKEIRLSGRYFFWEDYTKKDYVYDSEEAISELIGEHKTLLNSLGELSTGSELNITYVLKNGKTVTRQYGAADGKSDEAGPIKTFSDRSKEIEVSNYDPLGTINDIHNAGIYTIQIHCDAENDGYDVKTVPAEEAQRLAEALKYDLLHNYGKERNACGWIIFILNGGKQAHYTIWQGFEKTMEFYDSFESVDVGSKPTISQPYIIGYKESEGGGLTTYIPEGETSGAANELIGYVKVRGENDTTEYSDKFFIYGSLLYNDYVIEKTDEEAALKALIRLADEYMLRSMQ